MLGGLEGFPLLRRRTGPNVGTLGRGLTGCLTGCLTGGVIGGLVPGCRLVGLLGGRVGAGLIVLLPALGGRGGGLGVVVSGVL